MPTDRSARAAGSGGRLLTASAPPVAFGVLPVEQAHALRAGSLPMIHRDPWDRLLVAQAQIENLPIITAEPVIEQYDVDVIW